MFTDIGLCEQGFEGMVQGRGKPSWSQLFQTSNFKCLTGGTGQQLASTAHKEHHLGFFSYKPPLLRLLTSSMYICLLIHTSICQCTVNIRHIINREGAKINGIYHKKTLPLRKAPWRSRHRAPLVRERSWVRFPLAPSFFFLLLWKYDGFCQSQEATKSKNPILFYL